MDSTIAAEKRTEVREQLAHMRFFDEVYALLYEQRLSDVQIVSAEVECLISLLHLSEADAVLDVACGSGGHVLAFAEKGIRATGQDLSLPLLEQARLAAQARHLDVNWVHQDMRTIPFIQEFDGIISLFSSFGYFEHEEDDMRVLRQVQQALKPGGRFLLDTRTLYSDLYMLKPSSERHPRQICIRLHDDTIVLEETYIDVMTNRRESLVTLCEPNMPRREYQLSIRNYTPLELMRMCEASGLSVETCFGDFRRNDYRPEGRLVLLCRNALDR